MHDGSVMFPGMIVETRRCIHAISPRGILMVANHSFRYKSLV